MWTHPYAFIPQDRSCLPALRAALSSGVLSLHRMLHGVIIISSLPATLRNGWLEVLLSSSGLQRPAE